MVLHILNNMTASYSMAREKKIRSGEDVHTHIFGVSSANNLVNVNIQQDESVIRWSLWKYWWWVSQCCLLSSNEDRKQDDVRWREYRKPRCRWNGRKQAKWEEVKNHLSQHTAKKTHTHTHSRSRFVRRGDGDGDAGCMVMAQQRAMTNITRKPLQRWQARRFVDKVNVYSVDICHYDITITSITALLYASTHPRESWHIRRHRRAKNSTQPIDATPANRTDPKSGNNFHLKFI